MSDADGTFKRPDRRVVVTALGITQILAWGSTLYLLGVLGRPIAVDTGWSYEAIIGGVSLGLLMASIISPRIGRAIGTRGGKLILSGSAVVLAVGLLSLGISQSIAWYLASWLLIGVGMGSGLTDSQKPANCGLLGRLREIVRFERVRGGPGRSGTM
jgi:MFS family permease